MRLLHCHAALVADFIKIECQVDLSPNLILGGAKSECMSLQERVRGQLVIKTVGRHSIKDIASFHSEKFPGPLFLFGSEIVNGHAPQMINRSWNHFETV